MPCSWRQDQPEVIAQWSCGLNSILSVVLQSSADIVSLRIYHIAACAKLHLQRLHNWQNSCNRVVACPTHLATSKRHLHAGPMAIFLVLLCCLSSNLTAFLQARRMPSVLAVTLARIRVSTDNKMSNFVSIHSLQPLYHLLCA